MGISPPSGVKESCIAFTDPLDAAVVAAAHSGPDRGVLQANFAVLRTARRPAVLVELGFSTNRADSRIMTAPAGQRALASAIADAVIEYLKELERKTGQGPAGPASR